MTILVINNHGGAIFSLLPIAKRTPVSVLNQYFYTSHDVSVQGLCSAHRYFSFLLFSCQYFLLFLYLLSEIPTNKSC